MASRAPEWVKGLAHAWGHEVRKFQKVIENIQGTMGRIADEGPDGASIRGGAGPKIPDVDFPEEVQKFHRAWLDLDYPQRNILMIHFKEPGPAKKKMMDLEIKKTKYYDMIDAALVKVAIDFHLYE